MIPTKESEVFTMAYLLLALTVCVLCSRSILMKYASGGGSNLAQMIVIFGTASVGSLLLGLITHMQIHLSTVIISLTFGVFNFLSQYLYLRAMKTGMASKVIFISSCSFLLQSIYSIIVFSEPVTAFKVIGLILVCAAQICFSMKHKDTRLDDGKRNPWFILAVASMVCSGIVGICQKYQGRSAYPGEIVALSFVATTVAALLPAALLAAKGEWKQQFAVMKTPRTLILSMILGIVAVVMNTLSTHVAGLIDGSIVFPVMNCGSLILNMILTHVLFKDHLTRLQYISIALGLAAICIIGL